MSIIVHPARNEGGTGGTTMATCDHWSLLYGSSPPRDISATQFTDIFDFAVA